MPNQWDKDARLVEVVLHQSRRIVKMDRGVLISETHHGFICANAASINPTLKDRTSWRCSRPILMPRHVPFGRVCTHVLGWHQR
jgi:hypothetical protein